MTELEMFRLACGEALPPRTQYQVGVQSWTMPTGRVELTWECWDGAEIHRGDTAEDVLEAVRAAHPETNQLNLFEVAS